MARSRRTGGAEGDASIREGTPEEVGEALDPVAKRAAAKAGRGTVWTWVIPILVFVVVMLIFILQNFQDVEVSFISLHGRFPLALSLFFSAVLGALIVAFAEIARSVRLRRRARRDRPL